MSKRSSPKPTIPPLIRKGLIIGAAVGLLGCVDDEPGRDGNDDVGIEADTQTDAQGSGGNNAPQPGPPEAQPPEAQPPEVAPEVPPQAPQIPPAGG